MNFWKFKDSVEKGKDSELILDGPISSQTWWGDEVTPQEFRNELKKMHGNLTVHINSNGGDVFAGVTIYNALKEYKGKVTIVVDALAASIASVIAMAGDVVEMAPGSMIMIHDPSSIGGGNSKDMRAAANILDKIKESIIPIYQEKTGLPEDEIAQMMSDETWMTAKKAVSLGFADKIRSKVKKEDSEVKDAFYGNFAYSMSSTKSALADFINKVNEEEKSDMKDEESEKTAEVEKKVEATEEVAEDQNDAEAVEEKAEEATVTEEAEEEKAVEPEKVEEGEPAKAEEEKTEEAEQAEEEGALGAADKLEAAIKAKDERIASLEAEIAQMKGEIEQAQNKASIAVNAKNSLMNRYASILDMATAVEDEGEKEETQVADDSENVDPTKTAYAKAFAELN